jgi:hypothetical protein
MAVLGLAAALGIGTTAAVLDYRSDARSGELVERSADDLEARTRDDGEAEADVVVEDDDVGAGGDDSALRELVTRELRGEDTVVDGSCKLDHEGTVTWIGSVLRRTSLDELPQLINVLRGEMSLVGPRPCLEWEADMFPAEYAERFTVLPGITGLWQVSGRSTLGTLDMLRLDLEYVRIQGIATYLSILARTVATLGRGDGAR